MKLQMPEAFAVVDPSAVAPSEITTVLPGSAVPPKVGVLSLVVPPPVVMTGGDGATDVDRDQDRGRRRAGAGAVGRGGGDRARPSPIEPAGVNVQLPAALAVVVPMLDAPS